MTLVEKKDVIGTNVSNSTETKKKSRSAKKPEVNGAVGVTGGNASDVQLVLLLKTSSLQKMTYNHIYSAAQSAKWSLNVFRMLLLFPGCCSFHTQTLV